MFTIVKDNKPSLRERCKEVEMPLKEELKATLDEMLQYLKDSQDEEFLKKHPNVRSGVGIAAPQIGLNLRMLAIYYVDEEGNEVIHQLVNPKIIVSSLKKCYLYSGEGCLSVDNEHHGRVYRDFRITVKAFDCRKGEETTFKAKGYEAIVLQHEIDHLNGILFYDHIDKNNPDKEIPGAIAI